MQENPYRSPDGSQRGQRVLLSRHAHAGDCSFVGLVHGAMIGGAVGAVAAICLLGWIVLVRAGNTATTGADFATVEDLISGIVVRISLGAVVGAVAGAPLGASLGLLAAKIRFRNPRRLPAIAAMASAALAALSTALLWSAFLWLGSGNGNIAWPTLAVIATVAGGLGGLILGRRLAIHVSSGNT